MHAPLWLVRLHGYFGNPRPRLAAAGSIALIIAGNQPFYPLYVYAIAGPKALVTLLTWLSTPFFLAVPGLCRRNGKAGLRLLLAAAFGNTLLSAVALGTASGVEWFYAPCIALVPLLFAPGERRGLLLGAIMATVGGMTAVRLAGGNGVVGFSGPELASLGRLHLLSVVALMALFAAMGWRLRQTPVP